MMQMLLTQRSGGGPIFLKGHFIVGLGVFPGDVNAIAQIDVNSDGTLTSTRAPQAAQNFTGEWLLAGAASSYECRWTSTSGTLSTGAASVWLNLGTTQSFGVIWSGGIGAKSCTGTLEIRDVATGTIQALVTISLRSELA